MALRHGVAGSQAGGAPQPFSLAIRNPKPSASYVVVVKSIITIVLIKINYCDYNYVGRRETAVNAVYKVLHRRGERPGILIFRQISLKVAFVVQSPSRPQ